MDCLGSAVEHLGVKGTEAPCQRTPGKGATNLLPGVGPCLPGGIVVHRLDERVPPRYSLPIKRLRTFLERLPGGHRTPTGPLTTSEAADAEELRQETLAKNDERIEREQEEAGRESDSSS